MADWAGAFEALGAGLQGKGNEYLLVQEEQKKRQEELSLERKKAWILDMDQAVSLAEAGDVGAAQSLLQHRIENIDRLNGDPQHTAGMLRLLQEGKVGEFVAGAKPIVERGKVEFDLAGKENKLQFGPGETFKGPDNKFYFATQKRNPISGEVETVMSEVPEGYQMVGSTGLTASEQINQKGAEAKAAAEGRETGGGNVNRLQGFVDAGYDAAKGIPVLKRAETLLELVETGGIDNAMLKAKKWFGVESANEAELSANLGKAILAQLRSTFGAAFTAKEGDKLEAIEANFGKSTEGNKRLIRQTLKLANEYVNIGLKAADKLGDYDTVQAITRLRDFTLDDDLEGGNIIEVDW